MKRVWYVWYSVKIWCLERPEKITRALAYMVPRSVALWVFVRVCAATRLAPDEVTYENAYKAWARGEGR